jgi:hypothetical protein
MAQMVTTLTVTLGLAPDSFNLLCHKLKRLEVSPARGVRGTPPESTRAILLPTIKHNRLALADRLRGLESGYRDFTQNYPMLVPPTYNGRF